VNQHIYIYIYIYIYRHSTTSVRRCAVKQPEKWCTVYWFVHHKNVSACFAWSVEEFLNHSGVTVA